MHLMASKYVILSETHPTSDRLHRIQATRDLAHWNVRKGDKGGWVEGRRNLAQSGMCWVGGEAIAEGVSRVSGNALLTGQARATDGAQIQGAARVEGYAIVSGNAMIRDQACVTGMAEVGGVALVAGRSLVSEAACVHGLAQVVDGTVTGRALVWGRALVQGRRVAGDTIIGSDQPI